MVCVHRAIDLALLWMNWHNDPCSNVFYEVEKTIEFQLKARFGNDPRQMPTKSWC